MAAGLGIVLGLSADLEAYALGEGDLLGGNLLEAGMERLGQDVAAEVAGDGDAPLTAAMEDVGGAP